MVYDTFDAIAVKGTIQKAGRTLIIPGSAGRPGTAPGWVITFDNKGSNHLPASATASILNVPILNFNIGDIITGFKVNGRMDSAGNTVTLNAKMDYNTFDASSQSTTTIATMDALSKTADYLVNDGVLVFPTPYTIAASQAIYLTINGTTAATTTIDILSIEIYYNSNS